MVLHRLIRFISCIMLLKLLTFQIPISPRYAVSPIMNEAVAQKADKKSCADNAVLLLKLLLLLLLPYLEDK